MTLGQKAYEEYMPDASPWDVIGQYRKDAWETIAQILERKQ